MNFRCLNLIGLAILVATVTSCTSIAPRVVNLTPQLMPTNPSGIYTITLLLEEESSGSEASVANVVIGGNIFQMVKAAGKKNVFTFDYSIPSNINHARYYFETLDAKGEITAKSEIYDLRLTNRYVVELESFRAKPGSAISVLGKGFRDSDSILFGGSTLETRFISENQLEFDVPAKDGGEEYQVSLQTSGGVIPISRFRIDYSELRSVPSRLVLLEGQTFTMVLTIDQDAPPEGVEVAMTLDRPELLEFESVKIEGGNRSTNVQVTGGAPGEGTLTIRVPAHNQLLIPIRIDSRLVE